MAGLLFTLKKTPKSDDSLFQMCNTTDRPPHTQITEQEKETFLWCKTMWSIKVSKGPLTPTHAAEAGGQAKSTEMIHNLLQH